MTATGNNQKELEKEILELKAQIKKLQKNRLGLSFEDKLEDVVELCQKNVPVLKEVKSKRIYKNNFPNNILIEGDNYHALSVLNYTHKEKIDLIYIDPPYNTGNKDFIYNDKYVDKEDDYRHSKWLSFMEKRLKIARDLMKKSGSLFISIDDNEQSSLKMLCDKIFGEKNFVTKIVVQSNPRGSQSSKHFAEVHEYILVYAKSVDNFIIRGIEKSENNLLEYSSVDEEGKRYRLLGLRQRGGAWRREQRPKMFYPFFVNPQNYSVALEKTKTNYIEVLPKRPTGEEGRWTWSKEKSQKNLDLLVGKKVNRRGNDNFYDIFRLDYLEDDYGNQVVSKPKTIWMEKELNYQNGRTEIKSIFNKDIFDYPKPTFLIKKILQIVGNSKSIILDFFAGSGTTGHAVLSLNEEDGGNRRFILVTNNGDEKSDHKIASDICYPRIKKVISGYDVFPAIPSNFSYYKTDFVDIENINKISDESKVKVTYQAGEMIAVREDTLDEIEKNDWWQIFEGQNKNTAIYFKEDKAKLNELVEKLEKKNIPTALYIFSWGKNEYKGEYSSKNIKVEDIPEPILEVYKEINRI